MMKSVTCSADVGGQWGDALQDYSLDYRYHNSKLMITAVLKTSRVHMI